ncbi:MAG: hypothetical protein K2M91_05210 [Lachnospiraceae bacterium]|nr:hypothetical protein [Lachnospiraceae bacterium]
MAKKKSEVRIPKNEQQLLNGIQLVDSHPLFGRLNISERVVNKTILGKNTAARTSPNGSVYLNKDCDHTPVEWAHIIAHCILHLAFGHFDADRMPGYFCELPNGEKSWTVQCDFALWNMACDIYICKFLSDVKFGTPFVESMELARFGSDSSEIKIYDYLVRNHLNGSENHFGTATDDTPDMIEPDKPLTYEKNQKNKYVTAFAFALADSVRSVINSAANVDISNAPQTVMHKAAQWFVNHYPLLGGIASGYRIIDTRENNSVPNDISIAAINVTKGEIYVNRAAGLNLEEWKFVLAHEYLHAGLQHHARRQGRDPHLWNAACDFVINGWLHEMQIGQMPSCGLLYDEELKNQSAEEIYDKLIENMRQSAKLETFRGYGKGDIIQDGYTAKLSAPTTLDEFCKNALRSGLEYHMSNVRGYIPAGLIEEIKALSMPPIPWDVQLAEWFDIYFAPLEKRRSYARPSRRQSSTPDIPRPSLLSADIPEFSRTYGVVIDTSGSMSAEMVGLALGAAASYSVAKDVPFVRVVFCDADAYDIGYVAPDDIAGRVMVQGRGGTVLQPAIDLLENAKDFPGNAPILVITDGYIEHDLCIKHEHAFLIPEGNRLPFRPHGKVFYFK